MLTGDMVRLREVVDAAIRTCRENPGFEWELACNLQLRANFLANRSDWAGDARRDADEALEIHRGLGDTWGIAEALSARGEARERAGAYREAAADYEAAIEHAERLGARSHSAVLTARLGDVLLEAGDTERGERLLREVIDSTRGRHLEALPAARLFLIGWLCVTGRTAEAREHLRALRAEFRIAHYVVFDAFILGAEAYLEVAEGNDERGLDITRQAIRQASDPLSAAMAPHMRAAYVVLGAVALAGLDGAGTPGTRPAASAPPPPGCRRSTTRAWWSARCAPAQRPGSVRCSTRRRSRPRTPRATASPRRRPSPCSIRRDRAPARRRTIRSSYGTCGSRPAPSPP